MIRLLAAWAMIGFAVGCATLPKGSASLAPGARFADCRGCPRMAVVPAGVFLIGSPPDEARRDPDEGPQKSIRFAQPFAVGRVPVMRGEYAMFAHATRRPVADVCYADRNHSGRWADEPGPSWRDPGYPQTDSDPAVCVNIDDVDAYLAWLNARSGGGYRLLSEAEYEYAARAGAATHFPWGDDITHDQANFGEVPCCHAKVAGRDPWLGTSPGGAFPANAWGLHDMQGNVWEWTADGYRPTLAALPEDGTPFAGKPYEKRVIRGAGWDDPPYYLRSANRYQQAGDLRGNVTGFRVAKTLRP